MSSVPLLAQQFFSRAIFLFCVALVPFSPLLSPAHAGDNDCTEDSECSSIGGCSFECDGDQANPGSCVKANPNCCVRLANTPSNLRCCKGTLYDPTLACCNTGANAPTSGNPGGGACGEGRRCCPIGFDDGFNGDSNPNRRCVTTTSCSTIGCPSGTTECKSDTQKSCCASGQFCQDGECANSCNPPLARCQTINLGTPAGVDCYDPQTHCCKGNELSKSVRPIAECQSAPSPTATPTPTPSECDCNCIRDPNSPMVCAYCDDSQPAGCSTPAGKRCIAFQNSTAMWCSWSDMPADSGSK